MLYLFCILYLVDTFERKFSNVCSVWFSGEARVNFIGDVKSMVKIWTIHSSLAILLLKMIRRKSMKALSKGGCVNVYNCVNYIFAEVEYPF